jgi:hypothetical protein
MTEVSGLEIYRWRWALSEIWKGSGSGCRLVYSGWCVGSGADGQEEKAAIDSRLVALKAGETIHPNPIFF